MWRGGGVAGLGRLALTSIFVWIQGPTILAWLANWRRRCSLDCCLLCSSRRAWSRLGTSCCTWWGEGGMWAGAVRGQPFAWQPLLGMPVDGWLGVAYLLPLGIDDLGSDGGVGVAARELDVVALGDPLGFLVDGQDGLPLPVGIWQRRLELVVG